MSLANFHDVRLPVSLAFGASGGPERRTEVIALSGGSEARNAVWSGSRRRWDVGGAVLTLDALNLVIAFFEARRGRLHGFRFRDFTDDRSGPPEQPVTPTDQFIAQGDGSRTQFELVKRYGEVERRILKPLAGTVEIALDGDAQSGGFSVDLNAGTVTFDIPPAPGRSITAGFEFDCAVRFDTDRLEATLESVRAGRIVSIPLVELTG
ncbi:MAG: DUF2460 domain-containing protein [Pseudomonadota bacterium]